jgi:uncharacterized protein (UPF0333 family)
MQRGSVQILSLVVILIIVVVGAYFYFYTFKNTPQIQNYQQTANPINNAISSNEIYTNSQLGFEFIYSKELIIKEDSEESYNQRVAGETVKAVSDFRKNFKGYVQYEPGEFVGAVVVLGKDN